MLETVLNRSLTILVLNVQGVVDQYREMLVETSPKESKIRKMRLQDFKVIESDLKSKVKFQN